MRRCTSALATAVVLACGPGDARTADTAAGAVARQPIALADVAGRWRMLATTTNGDPLTVYELAAGPDSSGWTITFQNRAPLPLRVVAVGGDSIVTEAGPYPSILQQNASVRSLRAVNRLVGDSLVGTFRAVYDTQSPDSVLYGRHSGRRIR